MNRFVELHDSTLDAITSDGDTMLIHWSPLIIHASAGEAGRDPGVVWTQDATLLIRGAQIEELPELPIDICEGIIVVEGVEYRNTLLHDVDMSDFMLKAIACTGESVLIHGTCGRLHLVGQPAYLERFPQGSTGQEITRRWRQEMDG